MSTTPEGKVKILIDRWIKKNMPGAVVYKPAGGAFGKSGEPDYHIVWLGFMIVVEAKADYGQPTAMQMKRLKDYQAAGAVALIQRGYDMSRMEEAKRLVQAKYDQMVLGARYKDRAIIEDAMRASNV